MGWRSALSTKTLQDMGVDPVAHIEGGFTAWKAAGAPVAEKAAKVANPDRPDRPDKGTAAANEPRS